MTPFAYVPDSALVKGVPVRPGAGTVAIANALGNSIGAAAKNQTFDFAFRPALSGGGLLIGHGYVSSLSGSGPIAPMIAGTAIGANPGPILQLDSSLADANGQSYAVLEVYPDSTGQLTPKTPVNIVHGNAKPSTTANVGRCVLAIILWNGTNPLRTIPVVQWNLKYLRVVPSAGGGLPAHYFL